MCTLREEIAKNLLYNRKKNKFTQKELAEKLGVKNSAVSNWENGLNSIDIDTLYLACNVFDVTFNDMYGKYATIKKDDIISKKDDFTKTEKNLINNFRGLSDKGQEYILETMQMSKLRYKKHDSISDSEFGNIG